MPRHTRHVAAFSDAAVFAMFAYAPRDATPSRHASADAADYLLAQRDIFFAAIFF